MFKRLGKALGPRGRVKVRIDVQVTSAHGLPTTVSVARIVWTRGSKVQMTRLSPVNPNGKAPLTPQ